MHNKLNTYRLFEMANAESNEMLLYLELSIVFLFLLI